MAVWLCWGQGRACCPPATLFSCTSPSATPPPQAQGSFQTAASDLDLMGCLPCCPCEGRDPASQYPRALPEPSRLVFKAPAAQGLTPNRISVLPTLSGVPASLPYCGVCAALRSSSGLLALTFSVSKACNSPRSEPGRRPSPVS